MTNSKLKTMTVAELIDALQGESPDALVLFSTDYGDYHHTPQALPIRGELEVVTVAPSAYSTSGWQVAEDEDDADFGDPDRNDDRRFLVIR